jgi:DNA polymerase (family 10)
MIRDWLDRPPDVPDPPEVRRSFLTMAEARATLAEHPEWRSALRADLQMHTTYSDGAASLGDMVDVASGYGHEYVAITDHSKGLAIARGMDEEELAQQGRDIDALNRELEVAGRGIRALRSIEMNLTPEGEGDMDPAAIAKLDLVLGAFHSRLRVAEDQTDRYVAALRNPTVHVLAHPRGRKFNNRSGLRAEWDVVLQAAADLGKAVEIDAYPDRQDLSVDLLRLAKRAGCRISIGTDAHGPDQLAFIELGLAAALLAGIKSDRVLNFMPRSALRAWVTQIRQGGVHGSGRRIGGATSHPGRKPGARDRVLP